MRQAAGVGGGEAVGRALGYGVLAALHVPAVFVPHAVRHCKDRAAAKTLVDFDPTKRNRADGVIFSFHGLRLTRTELIRGYGEHTQRIPLQGLSASLVGGHTVQIRIDGPGTMFFYRNAFDADFNQCRAQQFAALLNYEASLPEPQSSGL